MTTSSSFLRVSRAPAIALAAIALAAPLASHAAYSVSGNVISWTNDGWYQVQRPATQQWDLCNSDKNPTRSCTVPNDTYTIINHTTGARWENVAVPQGGSTSGQGGTQTVPLGPQPNGAMTSTECQTRDTWAFLQNTPSPLASNFYGGCNPGAGISTRAWVSSPSPRWLGQGIVNTGTAGKNFWIDWKNTGSSTTGTHAEFDIAVARDVSSGAAQGYGQTRYQDIPTSRDISLTANAQWMTSAQTGTATPEGKSHVQTIIWMARQQGAEANAGKDSNGVCVDRQTVDITVTEYMNNLQRTPYVNLANGSGSTAGVANNTAFLGNVTTNGSTYRMFRRLPGDVCEVGSYLAIRTANRFGTTAVTSTVNPRPFIDFAIAQGDVLPGWRISNLGWEIAGASRDLAISGLNNSAGKFVFNCYSIPSLVGTGVGSGYDKCQ